MDEGNGLYFIRARYYDPETGRFLTKDPLTGKDGDTQSLNRYVYALNNPVVFFDISGCSPLEGPGLVANFASSDTLHNSYAGGYEPDLAPLGKLLAFGYRIPFTNYLGFGLIDEIIRMGLRANSLSDNPATGLLARGSPISKAYKIAKGTNAVLTGLSFALNANSEIAGRGWRWGDALGGLKAVATLDLSADEWIVGLKDASTSITAITLNTLASPFDPVVGLASGGQVRLKWTGAQIESFISQQLLNY
jgi:RHS repeat-associated protein